MATGYWNDNERDAFSRLCVIWGKKSDQRPDDAEEYFPIDDNIFYYFEPDEAVIGKHTEFTIDEIEDVTDLYADELAAVRCSGVVEFDDTDHLDAFSKEITDAGISEEVKNLGERGLVGFKRLDADTFARVRAIAKSYDGDISSFFSTNGPSENSGSITFEDGNDVKDFMGKIVANGMQVLDCKKTEEYCFEFADLNHSELKMLSDLTDECGGEFVCTPRYTQKVGGTFNSDRG